MTDYLSSGSAFERMAHCPSSAALPHANHETVYSSRGTAIHEFLENVNRLGRDEALSLVDAEWRQACEALNLEGLDGKLSLAAEVALAYDFETDTARELGRGVGRKYGDVKESELPSTLDVVGVRNVAAGKRGLVIDWKTGWTTRRRIETVTQLDVGALLAARAYGLDVVEVQLIHVFEDIEPWVQRRVIEGWEIDAFAMVARQAYEVALEQRRKLQRGERPTSYNTGPWCDGCSARQWCDAQTRMIRSVLARDEFDGEMRMQHLDDATLSDLWHRIREASSALSYLKGKVLGVAATRTIPLGRNPENGKDRYIGKVTYEGNEKLDGEQVFDVVSDLFKDESFVADTLGMEIDHVDADAIASAATQVVSSKKLLKDALKKSVKRGKGALAERAVLAELRKRGGAKRDWKTDVKEYETKQLTEGDDHADRDALAGSTADDAAPDEPEGA